MELKYSIDYNEKTSQLLVDAEVCTRQRRKPEQFVGIIDTGAQVSIVSPKVIEALQPIVSIDWAMLRMANQEPVVAPVYRCSIKVGGCTFNDMKVAMMNVNKDYDIVIGIDMLQSCDVTIRNHTGSTRLTLSQNCFR